MLFVRSVFHSLKRTQFFPGTKLTDIIHNYLQNVSLGWQTERNDLQKPFSITLLMYVGGGLHLEIMQKTPKPKFGKLNCTLRTRYNGLMTINLLQMAFSRIINNVEMLYGRIIKQ